MIEIRKPGRPLMARDIAQIEERMGSALPPEYRDFLLTHNGGRPRPDSIDISGAHFRGTDVKVFLGVERSVESQNISWALDTFEGCVDNKLLPIAGDSFGHSFMLALDNEHYGEVYYFDAAEIPPRPYFVARDFNEFLSKLREPTLSELAQDDEPADPQS